MDLKFLPERTGLDRSVSVADALAALCKDSERTLPPRPKLVDYFSPHASLDKASEPFPSRSMTFRPLTTDLRVRGSSPSAV